MFAIALDPEFFGGFGCKGQAEIRECTIEFERLEEIVSTEQGKDRRAHPKYCHNDSDDIFKRPNLHGSDWNVEVGCGVDVS